MHNFFGNSENSSQNILSAHCRPTVARLLSNCRPTIGQRLADSRPTVCQQLADRWPTVGQQLADRWPTVGQQFALCLIGTNGMIRYDRQVSALYFLFSTGKVFYSIFLLHFQSICGLLNNVGQLSVMCQ